MLDKQELSIIIKTPNKLYYKFLTNLKPAGPTMTNSTAITTLQR
jgi:hypothetical protein